MRRKTSLDFILTLYLGVALASSINVLNPETIVIGSGGVGADWKLFLPHLQKTICRRAYGEPAARAKISLSDLGSDAGIIGAARLGFGTLSK